MAAAGVAPPTMIATARTSLKKRRGKAAGTAKPNQEKRRFKGDTPKPAHPRASGDRGFCRAKRTV